MANQKRINIVTVLLLISSFSFAQSKGILKADEAYNEFNFSDAIELYEKALKKGESIYYVSTQIADCYSKIGNSKKAIEWYEKAINVPSAKYNVLVNLSVECRKEKQYAKADEYLKRYYQEIAKSIPGDMILTNDIVKFLKKDSLSYVINQLSINTKYSDFGPVIYGDNLLFSSNKSVQEAVKRTDVRNENSFYKLYSVKRNGLSSFQKVKPFDKAFKTKYNDGPLSFNSEATVAFITNNFDNNTDKALMNVVVKRKLNDEWSKDSTPLPLFQRDFSFMHAFLSDDETKIYFVSDMPNGYGGTDIYYSDYKNGFLSKPVNLGPEINTSGNELFPFINKNGTLFFSSNGHNGLGGLDIYYASPADELFSEAHNVGYPLNTADDDFNLITLNSGESGYFCSNRPGGVGEDDIYSFKSTKSFIDINLQGFVYAESEEQPLANILIDIYYKGLKVRSIKTIYDGSFSINIESAKDYTLVINHNQFKEYAQEISPLLLKEEVVLILEKL